MEQNRNFVRCLMIWIGAFFLTLPARGVEVRGPQSGTWSVDQSPYYVIDDVLVPQGESLTIQPGVVIKFDGYRTMRIEGTLRAIGARDARIVFTSKNDNEFGDYLANLPALPTPKDWAGIEFAPSSSAVMEHCIIRYSDRALSANMAAPILRHIIISDCSAKEIVVDGQSMAVQEGVEETYRDVAAEAETVLPEVSLSAPEAQSGAEETPALGEEILPGQEFSFGEISVISAAKYAQRISEAPAAISVLTGEDIQWVGYSNLADMVRFIPGIDVFTATAGNINLNPRGYNRLYSNRTLVLVDGRTVYLDFFGVIFWPTLPVQLEEIDRLEVIRGPGGSLYGANAYSGVINVMTKKPEDINGTQIVSRTGGRLDTYRGSLVHGGRRGNTSYKLSLGWQTATEFNDRRNDALKTGSGDFFVEQHLREDVSVSFEAGYSKGMQQQLLPWGVFAIPVDSDIRIAHGKGDVNIGNWKLSSYINSITFDALGRDVPFEVHIDNNLINFSLENYFALGSAARVVWGGTYRGQTFDGNVAEKLESLGLLSGFGQFEWRPWQAMSLTLGARADQNPAKDIDVPLKASLMFFPGPAHAFRLSYGRSYRSASLVETFVLSQFGQAYVRGNPKLRSEAMESYELGYRGHWFNGMFGIECNLFYQELKDFIIFAPYAEGFTFDNFGRSHNAGGELEINFMFPQGLRGRAYYAYQKIEDEAPLYFAEAAPKHKYGLYMGFQKGKLIGFVGGQYIDKFSVMIAPLMGVPSLQSVDEHFLVNARLGFRVNSGLEISVEGFNVLNEPFREYPLAETLRNRVTCTVKTFF